MIALIQIAYIMFMFLVFVSASSIAQFTTNKSFSAGLLSDSYNFSQHKKIHIYPNLSGFSNYNLNPMKNSLKDFLISDKDKYSMSFKNNFLFLIPPLAWNVAFTTKLQMDYFSGEAPTSLLVAENVFRYASMLYPMVLPIDTQQKYFKPGLITYSIGTLLYFGSWLSLIYAPESTISQTAAMRFAPVYLPFIWLTGMSLMSGSKIQFSLSTIFIGLHLTEYIMIYNK